MSHRVEAAPDGEEEEVVVEIDSDNEGTIDLGSEDGEDGNSLPSPEDDDKLALTNREFNEQLVFHTTPPTSFPNYLSPSLHLPLSNRPNDVSTILNNCNDPSAPQKTTMHDNAEQPDNQQSIETGKF